MPGDPWLVPVTALRRSPGSRLHQQRRGPVGELQVAASTVAGDAEVAADVVLEAVDGAIEVTGQVSAPWQGECRRCLGRVEGQITSPVRELYRSRLPGEEVPGPDEDTYPLSGQQLDLRPLVRDAILLELPLAPLCRPDCAGLCPSCGADRNDGPCGCAPPAPDTRWSVLDPLLSPGGDAGSEPST